MTFDRLSRSEIAHGRLAMGGLVALIILEVIRSY